MTTPLVIYSERAMSNEVGIFAGLPGAFVSAFGESITYEPASGEPVSGRGIFVDPFAAVTVPGVDVDVESHAPELHVRQTDFPELQHGDTATVRGESYRVIGIEPDGKGMVRLVLQRT